MSAPAGCTCPADGSPDLFSNFDDASFLGYSSDNYYRGQTAFDPGANKTVCKVGVYYYDEAGTTDSRNQQVSVWTTTTCGGSQCMTTQVGDSSTAIAGSAITTSAWNYFSWSGTKPNLTSGGAYSIVVDSGTADASNYFRVGVNTTNSALVGSDPPAYLSGSQAAVTAPTTREVASNAWDFAVKIYYCQ